MEYDKNLLQEYREKMEYPLAATLKGVKVLLDAGYVSIFPYGEVMRKSPHFQRMPSSQTTVFFSWKMEVTIFKTLYKNSIPD